jgi:hypothetical protein
MAQKVLVLLNSAQYEKNPSLGLRLAERLYFLRHHREHRDNQIKEA